MKKEIDDIAIKDMRNLFRLKKENTVIKDRILRDIRNLFGHEEVKTDYKPVRASNFWCNNYIEYESKYDKNKTISVEENLNKFKLCLKDIINNLKKNDTQKIQSIIAISFTFSKENDEEH